MELDEKDLTLEQRCVLHAYWRARVYHPPLRTPVREVASICQSDAGYGTVSKAQVTSVLAQLIELGWKIDIFDLVIKPPKKPITPLVHPDPSKVEKNVPRRKLRPDAPQKAQVRKGDTTSSERYISVSGEFFGDLDFVTGRVVRVNRMSN